MFFTSNWWVWINVWHFASSPFLIRSSRNSTRVAYKFCRLNLTWAFLFCHCAYQDLCWCKFVEVDLTSWIKRLMVCLLESGLVICLSMELQFPNIFFLYCILSFLRLSSASTLNWLSPPTMLTAWLDPAPGTYASAGKTAFYSRGSLVLGDGCIQMRGKQYRQKNRCWAFELWAQTRMKSYKENIICVKKHYLWWYFIQRFEIILM